MKKISKLLLTSVSVIMAFTVQYNAFADDTDYADVSFSVGSRNFLSKGVQAFLDASPAIVGDTLMVPGVELLRGLGYKTTVDTQNTSITAVQGESTMKFQLNSNTAIINGEARSMPQPLMLIKKKLFLPVRFIAVNSGAGVAWNQSKKQVSITKMGEFNTGQVLLVEKAKDGKNILSYDGYKLRNIAMNKDEVVSSYYFKGKVLLGLGPKGKKATSLALCEDDNYVTLLDDFDINGTFEFNNNLIIYGYDEKQGLNKIYRFDGSSLNLIANNLYLDKYVLFGDKLLINQYDNFRNYSLVVFDKNSWQPYILSKGFALKDSAELDGNLYMTGAYQEGTNRPLAVYDGKTTSPNSFSIINVDINVDLQNTAAFGGNLYSVSGNSIKVVGKGTAYDLLFPFNSSTYFKYDADSVKLYNGKLYFGVTGTRFVDIQGKTVSKPNGIGTIPPFVLEYAGQWNTRKIVDNFSTSKLAIDNGKLLILGKEKADSDSALYIFDGLKVVKAVDVYALNKTISLNGNLLTDVKDKDRSSNKYQNTILLYDNANISNVISGLNVKQWTVLGNTLYIAGNDKANRVDKLYRYTSSLNEIESNYKVTNWSSFQDVLFVNGYDTESKTYSVIRFADKNNKDLGMNIEISKMIKVKDNNYLVYAVNKEKGSHTYGKKVLYFYNDSTNRFEEMKVGLNLSDMIYIQ